MQVKWIKLNVGMFDGNSFKRIKKAKIGGESFRDKLTAVWFELMDFAGKCNAGGQLIESPEIPFANIEDIAIMIDRETDELQLCMNYYINNGMVTLIDDVYMLTSWTKYQNEDGLEKIREKNRKRVAKHRANQKLLQCNVTGNVTVTECNAIEEEKEEELEKDNRNKNKKISFVDSLLSDIADDDLRNLYYEYVAMRKVIKSPITTKRALEMLVNKVNKLEPNDIERQKKMLENAIVGNWKSVYPLKDEPAMETKASYSLDKFDERSLHSELKYERKKK
jgi:predicted phage replisome organizer